MKRRINEDWKWPNRGSALLLLENPEEGGRKLIANAHLFTLLFAPERLRVWCFFSVCVWWRLNAGPAAVWAYVMLVFGFGGCAGEISCGGGKDALAIKSPWRPFSSTHRAAFVIVRLTPVTFTCCHSRGAITKLRVLWVWLISWIFPGCLVVNLNSISNKLSGVWY